MQRAPGHAKLLAGLWAHRQALAASALSPDKLSGTRSMLCNVLCNRFSDV